MCLSLFESGFVFEYLLEIGLVFEFELVSVLVIVL